MPLLLVAVGPLLIASFAFNFNNFSLIYLLTRVVRSLRTTPASARPTC
jgi:ABC-type sugar transport system permease subunit